MKRISLPPEKGIYVLVLECVNPCEVRIGSLGTLQTEKGYYAYIGSAHGGGGIKSRLGRHLKTAKKCRWHIDYLRRRMRAAAVWYETSAPEAEHEIAERFISMGAKVPMKGFGSSDCSCETHLFLLNHIPEPFLAHSEQL